jgi:hypothetical protein
MVVRLLLLTCVLLTAVVPGSVLAGDEIEGAQVRYIDELKQRNVDYGPGCNGIGVSIPQSVEMPADLSTRWVAGHSACIPGMRLVMICIGEVAGADRVIGCLLRVADGEAAEAIGCDLLTLITPGGRFTPDPLLSKTLSEGSESASKPCSEPGTFAEGTTVAAAFLVPAAESTGDLAILLNLDGSEVPAFLLPSSQMDASAVPSDP